MSDLVEKLNVIAQDGFEEFPDTACEIVGKAAAEIERLRKLVEWQPIETAPKGGGAEMVTDPNWIEPPRILLLSPKGDVALCYWDWYYAEGGRGCVDGVAWIVADASEKFHMLYDHPTHWLPLPPVPGGKDD